MKLEASTRLTADARIGKTYKDLMKSGFPDQGQQLYQRPGVLIKKKEVTPWLPKLQKLGYKQIDQGPGYQDFHAPGKAVVSLTSEDEFWEVTVST